MGRPSRRARFVVRALVTGVLLGLVPVSNAAPAAAADDPTTAYEAGMPDDNFDDEGAGEQDDFAGAGSTGTSTLVAGRAGDFQLKKGGDLSGLVSQLDAALPKETLTDLMKVENTNRDAAWDDGCGTKTIYDSDLAPYHRVCWKSDDATSTEWVPQAITGISDAQEDETWGTSDSNPLAVASYDAQNPGRSDYASGGLNNCLLSTAADACNEKGVRVSFFNTTSHEYRHVLLVWPYVNSKSHISFDALHAREGSCVSVVTSSCAAQNGIHAGGMAWYGNYLYVADTANGLRVFDMRQILDLNPDNDDSVNDPTPDGLTSDVTEKKLIGRQSNVWYSFGYRYVMPQVASLKMTTAKNGGSTDNSQCYSTGRPKVSYVSLDRTGTDHMVIGEYCNLNAGGDSPGRVATYPMTALTTAVEGAAGTLADADAAYGLPATGTFNGEPLWHKIQGVMRYEGKWYFHRSNGYSTGRLLQATVQTVDGTNRLVAASTVLKSAIGPEDLYLTHGRGTGLAPQLWSLSEHASSACSSCKREIYSYPMSDVIGGFGL
ncbi:hypothetical protein [Streptomyces sp. NPDC020996]|uniref:hypothetical protein n=1 Tax=Streptomyces sp. NPDC020996 TaxID=3154791 RepID=UPI0033E87696